MFLKKLLQGILFISFSFNSVIGDLFSKGCWTNNIIRYTMIGFTGSEESYIKENIALIHKFVCIRWLEIKNATTYLDEYVMFVKEDSGNECSSQIYENPTYEDPFKGVVIILTNRCFSEKVVMHEMMHAMGFNHEHQRADRDCYVEVDEELVNDESYKILHKQHDWEWLERFPYDIYSVIHYSRTNQLKALSEKKYFNYHQPLGNNRGELTILDFWKLLYKFCHFPHYCDVFPLLCELMEYLEGDCYSHGPTTVAM